MTKTNEKFAEIVKARRAQGKLNEKMILDIVKSTKQPLSLLEIATEFMRRRDSKAASPTHFSTYIKSVLSMYESQGLIVSRLETADERKIRANGHVPRGHVATLYMLASNGKARRTVTEALTGIKLKDTGYTGESLGTYKYKKNKSKKKKTQARSASTKQTDIEILQARIRELEAKLLAIQALAR
jgi:hypothetical protein